jgi:hypothetical protein
MAAILLLPVLVLGLLAGSPPPPKGEGKIALATADLELKGPSDADYRIIPAGSDLEANSWIRTGPKVKLAVDFSDGTELRINEKSEILIENSHQFEIKVGDIYLVGAQNPQKPFRIKTQFSPVEITGGTISITFHRRDPSDPDFKKVSRTQTMVLVAEGTAQLGDKQYTQKVVSGYWCNMVDGTLNTPGLMGGIAIPTRWVHDLLVKRGKPSPEIDDRLKQMLRMLGHYPEGQEDPSDLGYRSLGSYAPPFLVEGYLKYPTPAQDLPRKRAVVRIIADLGGVAQAPALVALLVDPDTDVRVTAARGLERLAGTNLNFDAAYWKGDGRPNTKPEAFEAGRKAWEEWAKKAVPKK